MKILMATFFFLLAGCSLHRENSCESMKRRVVSEVSAWPAEFDRKSLFLSDEIDSSVAEFQCGYRDKSAVRAKTILNSLQGLESYWDYPNAVHVSYTVIGLQYVEQNNIELARQALIASVPKRASPQLKTAGPSMMLADKISRSYPGDSSLLQFFEKLEKVWPAGGEYLHARAEELEKQESIDFGVRRDYLGR